MISLPILSLLLAQAATTLEQDRLTLCQDHARRDPVTAISTASAWLGEGVESERSSPHQCLGFAYVSLLRWEAAEQAFIEARAALPAGDQEGRARLAAMAGNAALAENRHAAARAHFELAQADADAAAVVELRGEVAADRARALVGLGALDEAEQALSGARRDAPQRVEGWLLSAALARRQERLAEAQAHIQTAAALAPADPAVGLEAGLIAALQGRDEAARLSWRSVSELTPGSPEAASARRFLEQLDGPAP